MIETEISIFVNRKSDIAAIKKAIIDCRLQIPVYLLEYENHFEIKFTGEYEVYEVDEAILGYFPDCEFVSDFERGRKETRIQMSRFQSPQSTDGWGRPIENPLNQTKYLVRRTNHKPERFHTDVKVLFGAEEQYYYVNIVGGIRPSTKEEGFLLLNEFKARKKGNEVEAFNNRLFKTPGEAFSFGLEKMKKQVDLDFQNYRAIKTLEKKEQEKPFRKMIRAFIGSCNKADYYGILKDLSNDIIFERKINWQPPYYRLDGIANFENYIKSPDQDLIAQDFKIRSSWDIQPWGITIGIKYYPPELDDAARRSSPMKYRDMVFRFKAGKIAEITEHRNR